MPLPVAHGLVGASIVAALHPAPARRRYLPLVAGALLANAADSDFLLVFTLHSRAWHRGPTHSLIFALVVCLLLALASGKRRLREALAYGLAYASHAFLDYATTKHGGGVELLWPFSNGRLMLGWVGLSELPSRLPATTIIKWFAFELLLLSPLLAFVLFLRRSVLH
ncbi:MAG TPA: metal-dependent hydrolase [Pyrinomonadaceae bacterium]|jgi:membrane-bound metal-dependent hydrolase YbcI (DUF457 family)|nr:metal-dependent hydrolase [Pyrinomonadaceae bacterium]